MPEPRRDVELKRLEGIATILAQIAAREPSFFELLAEDAEVTARAREVMREMQRKAGIEATPRTRRSPSPAATAPRAQVAPRSAIARQLANPFLKPDFSGRAAEADRRAGWSAGS